MNKGTKIRTALAIATSINMALATLDIAQFGNETANLVYKIVSMVVNAIVVALVAYYNNDYTEEGAIGTILTRQLKSLPPEEDMTGCISEDEMEV